MKRVVTGTAALLLCGLSLSGVGLIGQAYAAADKSADKPQATNANVTLKTEQDKLSYAMGVETGKAFKKHDITLNPEIYSLGVKDGLQGNKTLLSNDEMKKQLQQFQQQTLAKLQQQLQEKAASNQKAETTFLQLNKGKSGVVATDSGLQYKVVEAGNGPKPTDADVVTVDYEGKLLDGKVFDSSYERGKSATFPVSAVIPGWQEALKLMNTGATWELYIPAKLAYGDQGAGGVIGPNEMLLFKVHLISVTNNKKDAATAVDQSTSKDQDKKDENSKDQDNKDKKSS